MLALSRSDVRRLASMTDAIGLMKTAFRELSAGKAVSPLRVPIDVHERHGVTLFMPAMVPAAGALGVKIVSVFPENLAQGLPTIHALVCLVSTETGQPIAVMDGSYLTALRTGAVSGAATDLLARPESRTLVVIGAGVQGVTQAAAVCAVRPIERIVAVDAREEQLARYRQMVAADWPELVDRLETATDAGVVREADIVCTATTAKTPVFADADIRPGTHINAVGSFTPEMQEVPAATIARAHVVLDNIEAALAETGDFIIPLAQGVFTRAHLERELGNIVAGTETGRTSAEQVTFFKSVGNAVQDVVVAKLAADRAAERGLGLTLDLTR